MACAVGTRLIWGMYVLLPVQSLLSLTPSWPGKNEELPGGGGTHF